MKRIVTLLLLCLTCPPTGFAASRYDGDGELSGRLEELRWYINRTRYAPEMEADRHGLVNTNAFGHPDYDCCEDVQGTNDFGSVTNQWQIWKNSKPPFAPNAKLTRAVANHCLDMVAVDLLDNLGSYPNPHNSPTNTHYPTGTTPGGRLTAESYAWTLGGAYGENIGAGTDWWYGPDQAHTNLFVDEGVPNRGHRKNILDYNYNLREIGLGYAVGGGWGYFTEDFGYTGTVHFLTDTIFHDSNADGAYTDGEGVSNIEIRLYNGATEAAWYDVSSTSGSFAVPIADLPDRSNITVRLVNRSGAARTLSIPLGFYSIGNVYLTNNETRVLGTYTQPTGVTNVGFRNVAIAFSNTTVVVTGGVAALTFDTLDRAPYRVEWTSNLVSGTWTPFTNFTASGYTKTVTDTNGVQAVRFYRAVLQRDS